MSKVAFIICDRCKKKSCDLPPERWELVIRPFTFDCREDGINGEPRVVDLCWNCRGDLITTFHRFMQGKDKK